MSKSRMPCYSKPRNSSARITELGENNQASKVSGIVPFLFISNAFAGKPVKLSARRLREEYLPDTAASFYSTVTVDGNLAGNAFTCRWKYDGKGVCWITQLVVAKDYRERGLASGLLRSLRAEADDICGIISSHPAACLAAVSSFGSMSNLLTMQILILTLSSDHRESASRLHQRERRRDYGSFAGTLHS